jgi:hypothetical protein
MPRLKAGDRVQLIGDIAHFYSCTVGVVVSGNEYPASVLNQYKVRLADGTEGTFFDFQLEMPAVITARLILDSAAVSKPPGARGTPPDRHVRMLGRDIDIHLRIRTAGSEGATIVGQIAASATPMAKAQATLLVHDDAVETTITDDLGEFTLRGAPRGDIKIEVFLPGRRILVPLTI